MSRQPIECSTNANPINDFLLGDLLEGISYRVHSTLSSDKISQDNPS